MKRVLIISLAVMLAGSVSAQKVRVRDRDDRFYARPRVSVGIGLGAYPLFNPYYPYYWYGPAYGYPYGYYRPYHESRLDIQIEQIRNDYQDRIWSVRHDNSLSRSERKQKVHSLKHERDDAILQARKDYYNRTRY